MTFLRLRVRLEAPSRSGLVNERDESASSSQWARADPITVHLTTRLSITNTTHLVVQF
ncbi:hypothetical protein [Streptomyces phytophilus]|uniref:hypothetical protein n=1 Tax=Streptomyces phytophilus TaxID=722715 RepID=UPI0015F0C88A|nr:hypothetical protein [Streptomyces phytophilus]